MVGTFSGGKTSFAIRFWPKRAAKTMATVKTTKVTGRRRAKVKRFMG
jgi:hypothetical protein